MVIKRNAHELTARDAAIHYTRNPANPPTENIVLSNNDISSADKEIKLEVDLDRFMEKPTNIFIGHTKNVGFYQQWFEDSNRINDV
ncbi:hypothetical protein MJO52_17580 [Microbulbifer variabilis]|uniref:Uncharacterized protein n=1 Tax=Microbulbifer variabilis TaxID=266805 RepID=A0ABY4V995_9GAMM|nr:hypothetical protein [Microbulbifer variabilis]USD20851.1 hypothetical protein MJO52_17580 [Microbulbifer variabilis]